MNVVHVRAIPLHVLRLMNLCSGTPQVDEDPTERRWQQTILSLLLNGTLLIGRNHCYSAASTSRTVAFERNGSGRFEHFRRCRSPMATATDLRQLPRYLCSLTPKHWSDASIQHSTSINKPNKPMEHLRCLFCCASAAASLELKDVTAHDLPSEQLRESA